ncbi:MAG: Terminase-like family protein [Candidatus Methanofastidiosum methylothiophilum]|uniref:Terminase-like family protein n=1 Tax=Candidatus Methanofastidiosum methylothiophilum TaxID=1705564 RepID=A0A150J3Y2_9EURY|nr:MAG: Terminase-like family protein [Candidatus Methanofastidiosum methylthiophilus]
MTIYQGWDLAIREKETSDYVVCTTIGVTPKNKIYVLDWFRDRMAFPDQVKQVRELYDEFRPERIAIETNAYQLALKQQVLTERILPIKEIENIKNKVQRIILSSVNYENGLVYLPIDHPYYNAFMDEYRTFDDGTHDDMLDSLDMAMRLILEPKGIPFKRGLRSKVHAR